MKIHELKTWPEFFQAIIEGRKTFEFRKDDRGFQVGHAVRLKEYDPDTGEYTWRHAFFEITYILKAKMGIPDGYCVFAMKPITE